MEINARELGLVCPAPEREAWISIHGESAEDLGKNVVCGYHIYDSEYRVFLVEATRGRLSSLMNVVDG